LHPDGEEKTMPIGITFDETMAGAFALGQSDPEQGAEAGDVNGITLTMNATVKIPDQDKFIAEPAHQGSLSGSIDFPPLGEGMKSKNGIFNLFSPSGEAKLRYMVYELAFMVDTKPYYLAGKKHVRVDFGFDLWSDTTTLFTTLHEGEDASGTVVGAGVLRLDMGDSLRLMSTIKVTGTKSKTAQAAAVAKFGSFFMGELWDIYGPEL
jgi:cholesterol oxidase